MTSVDSGVETGNDSNDSSIVQHESQHATSIATAGHVTVDTVASVAIMDTCESNNNSHLTTPDFVLGFKPHRPFNPTLMENYKFDEDRQARLLATTHVTSCQPDRRYIHLNRIFKVNVPECDLECEGAIGNKIRSARNLLCDRAYRKLRPHRINEWRRPLHERRMRWAAATNDIDTVKELLRNHISPNNHDPQGRTPLHHAACRGYIDMVHLLLEHGADPNRRDCVGNTPLHLAAAATKASIVMMLLSAGTDVSLMDQHGCNPLQLAQAKLKILRSYSDSGVVDLKLEMRSIIKMLMTYFLKHETYKQHMESLNDFCSRLSLSNTKDQVQNDVKDLLANIEALSITS